MTTILLLISFILVAAYALNHITFNVAYNEVGKQGKTWEKVTDIDSSAVIWYEYSYPAMVADGNNIYLTYTYKRSKIKYVFVEFEG